MIVANFFQKFEGQGQRSKVSSIEIDSACNNDDALPFI